MPASENEGAGALSAGPHHVNLDEAGFGFERFRVFLEAWVLARAAAPLRRTEELDHGEHLAIVSLADFEVTIRDFPLIEFEDERFGESR